jgi:uncharacterized protein (TIGR01777 family)
MPVSADDLYAWHARPLAFQRLQPPWEKATVVRQEGAFGTDRFLIAVRTGLVGPIAATWEAEAYDFRPGEGFRDRELKGPFAFWQHTHNFTPAGPDDSFLEDRIEYQLPLGALGRALGSRIVRRRLAAMFAYRHRLTASDLGRHKQFRHLPRLNIAITGSRGMIGSELVPFLTTGGHSVTRLVTGAAVPPFPDGTKWVAWKPDEPLDPATFDRIDAVIHLAGDNVADGRWSAAKKHRILASRTVPTARIAAAIAALPEARRPRVFICASGVGYYGNRGDEELTEDSAAGTGFFPDVVRAWECACAPAGEAGVRTVNIRTGVALSLRDGALAKQMFAFKMGAGAVLGSGKQWFPWITTHDLVGAIHHALYSSDLDGPVNGVGPNPVTNRTFTKTLARVLHRPALLWLPRIALRVMFGELANELLLASTKALPTKLQASGFRFEHPELEPALRFLLGR